MCTTISFIVNFSCAPYNLNLCIRCQFSFIANAMQCNAETIIIMSKTVCDACVFVCDFVALQFSPLVKCEMPLCYVGYKICYSVNTNLCSIICCHFFRKNGKRGRKFIASVGLCRYFHSMTCAIMEYVNASQTSAIDQYLKVFNCIRMDAQYTKSAKLAVTKTNGMHIARFAQIVMA